MTYVLSAQPLFVLTASCILHAVNCSSRWFQTHDQIDTREAINTPYKPLINNTENDGNVALSCFIISLALLELILVYHNVVSALSPQRSLLSWFRRSMITSFRHRHTSTARIYVFYAV